MLVCRSARGCITKALHRRSACARLTTYVYARHMVWNRVARSYMRVFVRACANRMQPARVAFRPGCREERYKATPKCLTAFPARVHTASQVTRPAPAQSLSVPPMRQLITESGNSRGLFSETNNSH